jgi:Clp amino terminal domain, pathogenicity island component
VVGHVRLGARQEQEGVAARALAEAGADVERVRAETVRLLAEYQRRQPEAGDAEDGDATDGDATDGGNDE